MAIEVVATDFDGTFVASDHTIRDDTVQLYHDLREKVKVVLCTGRVYTKAREAMTKFRPDLKFNFFPGVYCHGAVVFGDSSSDVIYKDVMNFEKLCHLIEAVYEIKDDIIAKHKAHEGTDACKSHKFPHESVIHKIESFSITVYKPLGIDVDFEDEEIRTFAKKYEEIPDRVFDRKLTPNDLKDVLYFAVTAHPCFLWQLKEHFEANLLPKMDGEIRCILPVPESLHVLKQNVNKAHGLQRLCSAKGWNANQLVAIGDAENDIEMLKWASCGIAMGNSTQHTKDVAKFVTDPANEGGWARAMRKYVLENS